jgi:hypothetical protein
MKKLAIISAIAMSGLFYNAANAQLGLHVGIRLFPHRIFVPRPVVVVQPQEPVYQEPVVSDDDCDFYYLPDVGAYYSVTDQCYYYQDGDNWISAAYLPGIYHDFDWRYARRFEIRQSRPYMHNDFYRNRYQGFDRDIARNHDDFRRGFDYRNNNNAYNNDHRFDNRGGYGQHFDNNRDNNDHRFDNKGGYSQHFDGRGQDNVGQNRNNQDNNRFGQQANQRDRGNNNARQNGQNQNRNRGSRDNQRVAQNNNGNNHDRRDRF